MPRNIGYPVKNRSIAVGKPFPGKSRSIGADAGDLSPGGATQHSNPGSGKAPRKGVLTKGGGHG